MSRRASVAVAVAGIATFFAFAVAPTATAGTYGSCDQAEAAGAAPMYMGDPDYSPGLDRDGDGVACETGSGGGPAPAPVRTVPSETCTDWMKLRLNPVTGQQQVCGPISSPAEVFYWIPAQPMPGGVQTAGAPCAGVDLFTFARSTDDYAIWCTEGTHVYLPGDVTVENPPQPIWGLYSP